MNRLKEYLKAIIISFEFLILLVGALATILFPVQIQQMASMIASTEDIVKYLALLPTGFFAWTAKEAKGLLLPGEEKNSILHEWPEYWRFKIHFNVAAGYSFIFCIMGLAVLVLGYKANEANGFMMLVISISGGFVVVWSIYIAKIRLSEIMSVLDSTSKKVDSNI